MFVYVGLLLTPFLSWDMQLLFCLSWHSFSLCCWLVDCSVCFHYDYDYYYYSYESRLQYDGSSIEHPLTQRRIIWTLSRQLRHIDLATTANRHQMHIEIKSILLSSFFFKWKTRLVSPTHLHVFLYMNYIIKKARYVPYCAFSRIVTRLRIVHCNVNLANEWTSSVYTHEHHFFSDRECHYSLGK